jgi:hypothetical protein
MFTQSSTITITFLLIILLSVTTFIVSVVVLKANFKRRHLSIVASELRVGCNAGIDEVIQVVEAPQIYVKVQIIPLVFW